MMSCELGIARLFTVAQLCNESWKEESFKYGISVKEMTNVI